MRIAALSALAVIAGACSLLAPQRDPSRFYTLTSLPAEGARHEPPARAGLVLGVGPVTLPGYLRRPQLATRVGPHQLAFSEVARWSEPLETDVARVLTENLSLLLSPDQLVTFPWFGGTPPSMTIAVDVQQFERTSDGDARLAARWVVRDGPSRAVLATRESMVREKVAGDDGDAVAALSATLSGLSREIADAIRALSPPAPKKAR